MAELILIPCSSSKNHDNHDHKMIREFHEYWIEKDGNGKMRFQLQKTWETKLRLGRWKRNNSSSNPSFEKKLIE
jgi:hypothetical protein